MNMVTIAIVYACINVVCLTYLCVCVCGYVCVCVAQVFSLKTHKIDHVVHGGIAAVATYGALMGATPLQIEHGIGMVCDAHNTHTNTHLHALFFC